MPFITFDTPIDQSDRLTPDKRPPGRHLAVLLAEGVEAAGFRIVEGVCEHDSYGWSFVADAGARHPVWCMLQLSDEWLLISRPQVPLLRRLFGRADVPDSYAKLDAALIEVASSIPGVSNVHWFRTADDLRDRRRGQP